MQRSDRHGFCRLKIYFTSTLQKFCELIYRAYLHGTVLSRYHLNFKPSVLNCMSEVKENKCVHITQLYVLHLQEEEFLAENSLTRRGEHMHNA